MSTRKHFSTGYVVYSTNDQQRRLACALTIAHKSDRLTNKRISRTVITSH